MTLFRFNYYGLTKNKFSSDIAQVLSKRNRFSDRRCAKFVGHVRYPTVISHPEYSCFPVNFPKFLNTFLTEHLWVTTSVFRTICQISIEGFFCGNCKSLTVFAKKTNHRCLRGH